MIRKPQNWENVQAITEKKALPAGGYVIKIIAAKVSTYNYNGQSFDKLEIAFDINDGEYKGFYQQDFDAQQQEDKRWKGVKRFNVPTDDGSDADALSQRILKGATEALEDSNPGYRWDWDETKLKGKLVGCIFRLEEWAMNGKKGWKAQPFKFVPVEDIKSGNFKQPKFKAHRDFPQDTPDNYQNSMDTASDIKDRFEEFDDTSGDLPF